MLKAAVAALALAAAPSGAARVPSLGKGVALQGSSVGRSLHLFGLTARDKAAHEEQRDAMIEARPAGGLLRGGAQLASAL